MLLIYTKFITLSKVDVIHKTLSKIHIQVYDIIQISENYELDIFHCTLGKLLRDRDRLKLS